jgi:hypothetical protein
MKPADLQTMSFHQLPSYANWKVWIKKDMMPEITWNSQELWMTELIKTCFFYYIVPFILSAQSRHLMATLKSCSIFVKMNAKIRPKDQRTWRDNLKLRFARNDQILKFNVPPKREQ